MTSASSDLGHLSDSLLVERLAALLAAERQTMAVFLAHLAEVDARKLYLPAACSSMHAYCVQVLRLSEDAAYKRIQAARIARRYPMIFAALAEGRLHLTGVGMLAPYLTDDNAADLLAAAAHRSKLELERLLAARFPKPDLRPHLAPVADQVPMAGVQLAPAQVDGAPAPVPPVTRAQALAPQRFGLTLTVGQATYDKLTRAQALLRHRVPTGDLAEVVDRALDALLAVLEKERLAATEKPRKSADRASGQPGNRHIPAEVRRAVFARDGEQCTFVSPDGRRCNERGFLELDHIAPVTRGGESTAENLRVRCRAHNQYAAEQALGVDFMERKRTATRDESRQAAAKELEAEALLGLRQLGFTSEEARRALAQTATEPGAVPTATLEQRLRAALAMLRGSRSSRCSEEVVGSWGCCVAEVISGPKLVVDGDDVSGRRSRPTWFRVES